MLAEQLVRDGDLAAALQELQDVVRKDPAAAPYRVFLFQLLCVLGDWPRALTQLNVAAELDAATLPMAQTYRAAIQCEALRSAIFSGARVPLIFGEPLPWLAMLLQALQQDSVDPDLAASLREQAFTAAPAVSGTIDGVAFDWLADADPRLGPVLEGVINGRYFWIPMQRIHRIDIDAPADLRDTVWTPASFTWTNGAQTVGLIPTRYHATVTSGDPALLLARRTEWPVAGPLAGCGLGQRMLASEAGEWPLMATRAIVFDVAAHGMDGVGHG